MMSRLDPRKLHVQFAPGVMPQGPLAPRRYTLTHSDSTGDLFLTVAPEVDRKQIAGWYTRLMRDEVLAEWQEGEEGPARAAITPSLAGTGRSPAMAPQPSAGRNSSGWPCCRPVRR
jgi:hypothetical protein